MWVLEAYGPTAPFLSAILPFLKLSSVGLYYLHLEESQPKPVYFYINIYPPSFLLVSTLPNAYYEYSKLDKFIGKHSRHSYSRQTMKAVIGSGQETSCFCVRLSDVILDSSQAAITELRSGTVIVKSWKRSNDPMKTIRTLVPDSLGSNPIPTPN